MNGAIFMKPLVILAIVAIGPIQSEIVQECAQAVEERQSCGEGQSRASCRNSACCWDDLAPEGQQCYYRKAVEAEVVTGRVCECSQRGSCVSFDQHYYAFSGPCRYLLARDGCYGKAEMTFNITADFRRIVRGSFVTGPIAIYINMKDVDIIVKSDGRLTYNGAEVSITPGTVGDGILIRKSHNHLVVTAKQFEFSWTYYRRDMRIRVSDEFKNQVCGMCGNYNGDESDDFQMGDTGSCLEQRADGIITSGLTTDNVNEFAASWKTANIQSGGCGRDCERTDELKTCTETRRIRAINFCSKLLGPKGTLKSCFTADDLTTELTRCIETYCHVSSRDAVSECAHATLLYDKCQDKSAVHWTITDYCPDFTCPMNMEYRCGYIDQPTCLNQKGSTAGQCMMGCYCKHGYLSSGKDCILPEDCGCMMDNMLIPRHSTVLTSDCRQSCTCEKSGGQMRCVRSECPRNGLCYMNEQGTERLCHCKPSEILGLNKRGYPWCFSKSGGVCDVRGVGHYNTFDNVEFDYFGACRYLIASDGCNGVEPSYKIYVDNFRPRSGKEITKTKSVTVKFPGNCEIHVGLNGDFEHNNQIKEFQLPYHSHCMHGLKIASLGDGKRLITMPNGIKIRWKPKGYRVTVFMPNEFAEGVCGLCGNFNADQDDEFIMGPYPPQDKPEGIEEGVMTGTVRYLGYSWTHDIDYDEGCLEERNHLDKPDPVLTNQELADAEAFCRKALEPFSSVLGSSSVDHSDIDALVEDCMYDVAWEVEDPVLDKTIADEYLCALAEDVASVLQVNYDIVVPGWEDALTQCPHLQCSERQVMSTCPYCQHTCFEQQCSEGLSCSPGCACQEGFVLRGEECIESTECGCKYLNNSLPVGEVLRDANCHAVTCSENLEVEISDVGCGANAECRIVEGERKCECNIGYTGDGYVCTESPITEDTTAEPCNALPDNCQLISKRSECRPKHTNQKCGVGLLDEERRCLVNGEYVISVVERECCMGKCEQLNNLGTGKGSGSQTHTTRSHCNDVFPYCEPDEPFAAMEIIHLAELV